MRSGAWDPSQGELLHREVESLLTMLHASSLTATLEEVASSFKYFAVSALGAAPDGDLIAPGGIAPFRVVEPLKWALRLQQ